MKTALTTILLMLILSTLSFAQWTTNGQKSGGKGADGVRYKYVGVLDSVGGTNDSLATNVFSLNDYDQPGTYFYFNYLFTSVTGAPNILVDLYGSPEAASNMHIKCSKCCCQRIWHSARKLPSQYPGV